MAYNVTTAEFEPFVNCYSGRVILRPLAPSSRSFVLWRRTGALAGAAPPYPPKGAAGGNGGRLRLKAPPVLANLYRRIPIRIFMEKYPVHNLASICQRMPLDVYVWTSVKVADQKQDVPIRVVKSEFCKTLKMLDGRMKLQAELTLNAINIYLD